MSLLTYASPWTSDEHNKKRTPTIRKNIKTSTIVNDSGGEPEEYSTTTNAPTSNNTPISLDEVKKYQDEKGSKVHELLNKMSSIDSENDGAHLANFSPLAPPVITSYPQYTQKQSNPYKDSDSNNPNNAKSMYVYSSDDRSLGNLPNYNNVYENKMLFQKDKPYYANMGIPTGMDNKLMERINYMVHLLEEQQHEKTANVTEEFLLYTFLGVFVIYVVDTFSRNGKYVR